MKNGGSTDSRRTACASAGRAVRPFQRHDFAPCFAVRSVGPCGLCLQNVLHTVSPLAGCISASFDGAQMLTVAGFLAPVTHRSGLWRMNSARYRRAPGMLPASGSEVRSAACCRAVEDRPARVSHAHLGKAFYPRVSRRGCRGGSTACAVSLGLHQLIRSLEEEARPSRSPAGVSAPGAGDHAPPLRLGCRWERRRHFHAAAFAGSSWTPSSGQ